MSQHPLDLPWLRLALGLSGVLSFSGCHHTAALRGRVDGLRDVVSQAERNGAYQCAPRELAMAQAHLAFAVDELQQGNPRRANEHYEIAEPNARAAFELSPAERCAPREIVVEAPPEPEPEPAPGDRDGDGLLDPDDQCPDQPEDFDAYEDTDGCPEDQDLDGDGVPDSRDLCVAQPEDADGRGDGDGCPDPDDDFDGVLDGDDACAIEAEDRDGYRDEDGCPEPDNDGDSIVDVTDQCPDEPGPAEEGGCPRVYEDVQVTGTHIRISQKIHFAFNRARILPDSFHILNTVAQVLTDYPEITLEIQGHTDDRGSDRYNQRLSDQRAAAVRQYLLGRGIPSSRLTSRGYGEARPIESNRTEEGRAINRRVELVRTDAAAQQTRPGDLL